MYGYDKIVAIKNRQNNLNRISELKLLLLSLFGGTISASISMIIFRHKIKKFSFLWKFILIMVIQIVLIYFVLN